MRRKVLSAVCFVLLCILLGQSPAYSFAKRPPENQKPTSEEKVRQKASHVEPDARAVQIEVGQIPPDTPKEG